VRLIRCSRVLAHTSDGNGVGHNDRRYEPKNRLGRSD
jgi:hypothetical protein